MGSGSYDPSAFSSYSHTASSQSSNQRRAEAREAVKLHGDWKKTRYSLVTDEHPRPLPIFVGLDVTGSMQSAHNGLIRGSTVHMLEHLVLLGERGKFTPQVLFAGLADRDDPEGSLQLGAFESDIRMYQQLGAVHLGGGGGSEHMHEAGYLDALAFIALKTEIECFTKQGRKGHVFLVGDEYPNAYIPSGELQGMFGVEHQGLSFSEAVAAVRERYHLTTVFAHTASYGMLEAKNVLSCWKKLIGADRVLEIPGSADGLAHVIATQVGVDEGLFTPAESLRHFLDTGTPTETASVIARAFGLDINEFVPKAAGFERA